MPADALRAVPLATASVFACIDARGVGRVELRRPELGNAYDGPMPASSMPRSFVTRRGAWLGKLA